MSRHEHHNECKHKRVSYCLHCDVVYCEKCGREWYKQSWIYTYPNISSGWTIGDPIDYTVTTTTNDHIECATSENWVSVDAKRAGNG